MATRLASGARCTYLLEMPNEAPPGNKNRTLQRRIVWFLAGSVLNYLLIATPFKYLRAYTELPVWQVSAASIGVGTLFFFLWNYFVNFRTDSPKRAAFGRYLVAVPFFYVMSTVLLTTFKHVNAQFAANLGAFPIDLDVVVTQLCLAWLKFLVYHKWAFPAPKQ